MSKIASADDAEADASVRSDENHEKDEPTSTTVDSTSSISSSVAVLAASSAAPTRVQLLVNHEPFSLKDHLEKQMWKKKGSGSSSALSKRKSSANVVTATKRRSSVKRKWSEKTGSGFASEVYSGRESGECSRLPATPVPTPATGSKSSKFTSGQTSTRPGAGQTFQRTVADVHLITNQGRKSRNKTDRTKVPAVPRVRVESPPPEPVPIEVEAIGNLNINVGPVVTSTEAEPMPIEEVIGNLNISVGLDESHVSDDKDDDEEPSSSTSSRRNDQPASGLSKKTDAKDPPVRSRARSQTNKKPEKYLSNANLISKVKIQNYLHSIGGKVSPEELRTTHSTANAFIEKFLDKLMQKSGRPGGVFTYAELEKALVKLGLIGTSKNALALEFMSAFTMEQLSSMEGILIPKKGETDTYFLEEENSDSD